MRQSHLSSTTKQNKTTQKKTNTHTYTQKPHLFQALQVPHRVPRHRDKVSTAGGLFPVPSGRSPRQDPDPYGALGVRKLGHDGVGLVTPGSFFVVVISEAEAATREQAPPPERSRRFAMESAARGRRSGVGWSVRPHTKYYDNADFYELQV